MRASPTGAELNTRDRSITLLLALVSLFGSLVAIEFGLRGVGFGGDNPLFLEAPEAPGILRANPDVMRRYFPTRAPKIGPEPIDFAKEKPEGGYRIVVQGGSSAAGFPYGRWAGLAGMLGDRLEATFPEREIEVVTTAMAAVNSYTLLDFVDEIVAVHPDAVLVYAGHNEYMGVMGVGSGLTASRSRVATLLYLRLRPFRIQQLCQVLVALGREALPGAGGITGASARHLMARAASGGEIPYGSEAYRRGLEQFEANLGAILEKYREAGIPVFLGTLVSNDKEHPPFARGDGDPDGAGAWYDRGRRALAAGRTQDAREAFRRARDRDALRFRAPTAFDDVIRRAAAAYGATLVDVAQRFEQASPDGIIGDELVLEHIHPNAEGYFLLADAFYDALRTSGAIGDWSGAPTREEARRSMPITRVDRILAAHALRELESDFPFRETRMEIAFPEPHDAFERIARDLYDGKIAWLEAMQQQLELYREAGRPEEAAVIARMAAQAYPRERATNFAAGALTLQLGDRARARRYLERSLRAAPGDAPTLRVLARLHRMEVKARTH